MAVTAKTNLAGRFDGVWSGWSNELATGWSWTSLQEDAAPLLREFFAAVDDALEAVKIAATDAAFASGQTIYVAEERARRSSEAVARGRSSHANHLGRATRALDRLVVVVRRAGVPTRPQPQDAAQEGALANLRTDLRMTLDPLRSDQLTSVMADLTSRAAVDEDALRLWLLAGTSWTRDYLVSRGHPPEAADMVRHLASAAVEAAGGKGMGQAIAAEALLEDGQDAARRLVDVWLPSVLEEELGERAFPQAAR